MEKRIHRNLKLTRHHPVLEPYLPRATRKMKLIRIQVKFLFTRIILFFIQLYWYYVCVNL